MIWIPGGTFRMGSDRHYSEEAPSHHVSVDGFWIDRTPVTNRQFRQFVRDTGYVTCAEIVPDPKNYPGALPHMIFAGSLVFTPPNHPIDLRDWSQWWSFMKGADWCHPYGPKSNIGGLDNHPVAHVAYADALAFARWAGKDLPTEAEWNSPHAAVSTAPSSAGVMTSRQVASIAPILGRAIFRTRTHARMASTVPRR